MTATHWAIAIMVVLAVGGWVLIGARLRATLTSLRQDTGENARNGHWLDEKFGEIEKARR